MLNASLLAIIDEAGVAVLTLTECLEKDEFLASRLTRAETLRHVRIMGASAANIAAPTQALLPEVEWRGWHTLAQQLEAGPEAHGEALWFAVRSLVPATLMWLRVYRRDQPQVYQWTPAPVVDGK